MTLTAGYWHTAYWPTGHWHEDYWQDYGAYPLYYLLSAAILTRFNTAPHSALWTDLNGRLYQNEAPQGVIGNYATYHYITNVPEYYFSTTRMEDVFIQFDLYSESQSSGTVQDMYEHLKAVFDDCVLSVSGYSHYLFERENAHLERIAEDNVWNYKIQYHLTVGV